MIRRVIRALRNWWAATRSRKVAPIPDLSYPLPECPEEQREWCGITGCCLYQCWDDWD